MNTRIHNRSHIHIHSRNRKQSHRFDQHRSLHNQECWRGLVLTVQLNASNRPILFAPSSQQTQPHQGD